MNSVQLRILKILCTRRASLHGLMTGSALNEQVAPAIAQRYMDGLVAAGFVEKCDVKGGHQMYAGTELGAARARECELVPSRVYGNPSMPAGSYRPTSWNTRSGSHAHLLIPSRGPGA